MPLMHKLRLVKDGQAVDYGYLGKPTEQAWSSVQENAPDLPAEVFQTWKEYNACKFEYVGGQWVRSIWTDHNTCPVEAMNG